MHKKRKCISIFIHTYIKRDLFQGICLCNCEAGHSKICRAGMQDGNPQTGADATVLRENFFFFKAFLRIG